MTRPSVVTREWRIRTVEASEPGALDGFETTCQVCGMVLRSSLRECLREDIQRHSAWEDSDGNRLRRREGRNDV